MKSLHFLILFVLFSFGLWAQVEPEKECGTLTLEELKQKRFPGRNLILDFEQQMQQKQEERRSRFGSIRPFSTEEQVYRIPVVVHVLHRGEEYGMGANIPDEQIMEQMRILNEDFRRQNADAANTPAIFQPVAADVGIEFVLAKTDPQGNPTTGIVRRQGTRNTWGVQQMVEMSNNSYWPAEDYLNIWVTNLTFGLIGWAQFPDFQEIPGIVDTNLGGGARTDGVVVDFELFGVGGSARPTSRGRTATHEVGHYLGLRHTWGDGNCTVDDFCLDTPNMNGPSNGCPEGRESCGELTMIQNYMDYSSDVCMNLFTLDQKGRMLTVLENAVRRRNLTRSPGLVDASTSITDISLGKIHAPEAVCDNGFEVRVDVRNIGTTSITSAEFELRAGAQVLGSQSLIGSLAPLTAASLTFSDIQLPGNGVFEIQVSVISVNGTEGDDNELNNQRSTALLFASAEALPVVQNFETDLGNWNVRNPDRLFTWTQVNAPSQSTTNTALSLKFFEHGEVVIGARDFLLSPKLDFSTADAPELLFRYAYAERNNSFYQDTLRIAYSTDCGRTFPRNQTLWIASGNQLATSNSLSTGFFPRSVADWKNMAIDLTELKGLTDVVIAFIGTNGRGNNLYLDDIAVFPDETPRVDLALAFTDELDLVYCPGATSLTVRINNAGFFPVDGFVLSYALNGQPQSIDFSEIELMPGADFHVAISLLFNQEGIFNFSASVQAIVGIDTDPSNNAIAATTAVSNAGQAVPFRENIKGNVPSDWIFYGNNHSFNPQVVNVPNQEDVIKVPIEAHEEGIKRIVLPSFDLRQLREASFHFKLGYAQAEDAFDSFRVWVLPNCTAAPILAFEMAEADSTLIQPVGWSPQIREDWIDIYIPLNEYLGNSELRIVLEVYSQGVRDVYLDDFEFFVQDIAQPVRIPRDLVYTYPNPTPDFLNVVFANSEFKDVRIRFWDIYGLLVHEQAFPNTFNQTYRIDMSLIRPGIYIMEVTGPGIFDKKRIVKQ